MKKVIFTVLTGMIGLVFAGSAMSQPEPDINAEVARLDIGKSTLDDVISIFGEPERYFWGNQAFTKDNLPSVYIAAYYSNKIHIVLSDGKVNEIRFREQDVGYIFEDKLKIGSSLKEALKVLGQPRRTVIGQPMRDEDAILYKDISGERGYCYYMRKDHGVRLFFLDYKVKALYLTSNKDMGSSEIGKVSKNGKLQKLEQVKSVKEFDDVRWKDLSKLNLSGKRGILRTLRFNEKTIWPKPAKMPADDSPEKLLKKMMDPGLGIRRLHKEGITGKGVNVAIIDQPMYLDHPEFAGKIVEYYDTGCGEESSMHGPAVASLLVGTNCGTAPDARVYYAAVPSWKRDTAYEVKGLDWIIQQNEKLPLSEKIRVVSVSAAPTSPRARDINRQLWAPACARAEAAGIMVIDCTQERRFIDKCWYNAKIPDSVSACRPGDPKDGYYTTDRLFVPSAPRTTAEERDKGDCSYQYCGTGGISWSIPYCAGVLALGWQLRPDIPPERMRELLFKSAYIKKDGTRIIHPRKFIRLVKTAKSRSVTKGQRKAGSN